jgi:ketosteroid isomerase-like protein
MDGVALIRRFFELALGDDLDGAAALLADDLVIHEPPGLPYGGEFHGVDGWRDVTTRANAWASHEVLGPAEWLTSGDAVVMLARTRFRSRTSGRSADVDVVTVLRVRDGRIAEMDVYYREPEAVAALA